MRTGISITITASQRRQLKAFVGDRNAPQKHVWRARIVLLSADRVGTVEIMHRTGRTKTCVWRWQERFMAEGTARSRLVVGSAWEGTRRGKSGGLSRTECG